jgi:hypothetical protein
LCAGLSSRSDTNAACRRFQSRVHSVKAIFATTCGLHQRSCFISSGVIYDGRVGSVAGNSPAAWPNVCLLGACDRALRASILDVSSACTECEAGEVSCDTGELRAEYAGVDSSSTSSKTNVKQDQRHRHLVDSLSGSPYADSWTCMFRGSRPLSRGRPCRKAPRAQP